MKMQNMKIVQKWREYAGPKDERLEAENAKIYEFGFILLSFGMLALLAYEIIAQQVAWVHNGANDAFHLFASPVDAAMYAWLFIVMLICAVLQTRKGYVDTNRFGQTENLPACGSRPFANRSRRSRGRYAPNHRPYRGGRLQSHAQFMRGYLQNAARHPERSVLGRRR